MKNRARRTLQLLFMTQVIAASTLASTKMVGAQTVISPNPTPTPTSPPTPPTGPFPWQTVKPDLYFFTDKNAVADVMEKSPKRSQVLESFRLSTESALRDLEINRAAGKIDPGAYKSHLDQYRTSIDVYKELSQNK